jgi:hypothetical protein
MFWFVPGGTIAHDRDLQTLRLVDEEKLIHVNRAHMISAKGRSVTLSTGETVLADAIVFCTGWQLSAPPLFSSSLCYELGLPTDPTVIPDDEKKHWSALDTVAENNIDQLYPILKNPPRLHMPTDTASPFRLFRSLIPSKLAARGDNSIVFLGNSRQRSTRSGASPTSKACCPNPPKPLSPTQPPWKKTSRTLKPIEGNAILMHSPSDLAFSSPRNMTIG